jgi:cathepsin L
VDYSNYQLPVVDQGGCGSCWAFATIGQVEGMQKIRNPSFNTILSKQNLVSCDTTNGGCNGGWPRKAMTWLQTTGGNASPTEVVYPYAAFNGVCQTRAKINIGINTVVQSYWGGNENELKAQVANYGPTVVAIQVNENFQFYSSGVFYDETCPSGTQTCGTVNHAVIVVGYGTDPLGGDYWLVKNSWGNGWGDGGYIKMARNRDNNCNIACWSMFTY